MHKQAPRKLYLDGLKRLLPCAEQHRRRHDPAALGPSPIQKSRHETSCRQTGISRNRFSTGRWSSRASCPDWTSNSVFIYTVWAS